MDLPVMPPVAPMLAKPVGELPEGPWSFEPKWDGFRTIVFRDGIDRRVPAPAHQTGAERPRHAGRFGLVPRQGTLASLGGPD